MLTILAVILSKKFLKILYSVMQKGSWHYSQIANILLLIAGNIEECLGIWKEQPESHLDV